MNTTLNNIDKPSWDWLVKNISDNPMFLDLFLKNPFEEFGGKTIEDYASDYGWPSAIEVLKQR